MLSSESGLLPRYDPRHRGGGLTQQQFPTGLWFVWCHSLRGISKELVIGVTSLPSPCACSVLASDIVTSLISVDWGGWLFSACGWATCAET